MYKTYTIVLPIISNDTINLEYNITEGDINTNEILINLKTTNDKAFDITSYTDIKCKVLKSDGTKSSIEKGSNLTVVDAEKGIIRLLLPYECVDVAGVTQSAIEIYNGSNKLTTSRFSYNVISSI